MNTVAIEFLIASYRVTINNPLQLALVILAVIGLVLTCLLVLRCFKAQTIVISKTANTSKNLSIKAIHSNKVQSWSLKKKSHCALLLLGNVIVFISALLVVLPVEENVARPPFDILLTPGFKNADESIDFNLLAIDKVKIEQALSSAQRIWLLAESAEVKLSAKTKQQSLNSPLYQWLIAHYPDKVFVLNSVHQLHDFWQQQTSGQRNNLNQPYSMPSLLQVYGDGLTQTQWQVLTAAVTANEDEQGRVQHYVKDSVKESVKENVQENTSKNISKSKLSYTPRQSHSQDKQEVPYDIKFSFFASKAITGLHNLHWPKQLILGQPLTVSGQLQQADDNNRQFQLSLINNNNVLDTIVINGNEAFSLTATSKIVGLFNYQLVLRELSKNELSQGFRYNSYKSYQEPQYPSSVSSTSSTKVASNKAALNKRLLASASVIEINENIAFSVVPGNQPRVLIKQSAPSFETRRLKQWLSQAGSSVHVISQISKNKWAQQKVNLENNVAQSVRPDSKQSTQKSTKQDSKLNSEQRSEQSNPLNETLLANYDIVILDSRMLLALNEQEVMALYSSVNRGLGLLINADATLLKIDKTDKAKQSEQNNANALHKLLSLFELGPADDSLQQVIAQWPDRPAVLADQIITPQAAVISINAKSAKVSSQSPSDTTVKAAASVNIESLVQSMLGQILVAKKSVGAGSVVISALSQTYPWALQANAAFYSHYWQYVLSKTSRSDSRSRWLLPISSLLAQSNHYQDICLLSPLDTVHAKQMILTPYPLEQNKQCGRFVAKQAGWFEFQAMNEQQVLLAKQARYFYDEKDFLAWQQANKHLVSKRWSLAAMQSQLAEHNYARDEHNAQANTMKHYQSIDKNYLWLLMFITLSLLWLERKWQSG